MSDRGKLAGSDRSAVATECTLLGSVRYPEVAGFRGAGAIAKTAGRQD